MTEETAQSSPVRKLWRLAQGSVWTTLGIATSALSLMAMTASSFGIELAKPNADLLYAYNTFVGRLYYFGVEWWSGFSVPHILQHYMSLHIVCAVTEIRRQHNHHVKNISMSDLPVINFRGGPSLEEQVSEHKKRTLWRAAGRAILLGPACFFFWAGSIRRQLTQIGDTSARLQKKIRAERKEIEGGASRDYIAKRDRVGSRVLLGILPTRSNLTAALRRQWRSLWWNLFWIAATPAVVIVFFVNNALSHS